MNFFMIRRTAIVVLIDCLFCWLSWLTSVFVFTYLFKNEHASLLHVVNKHTWSLLLACFFFFLCCGVYRSLWQYFGVGSILRIIVAALLTSFSMYVTMRLDLGYWLNPGIGMMAFYFFLTLSLTVRVYKRVVDVIVQYTNHLLKRKGKNEEQKPIRTLIIGAGVSASSFLLNINRHGEGKRIVLGILDSDSKKHGYNLHGATILGDDSKLPHICRLYDIEEILIAIPSIKNENLNRIVKMAIAHRCKVKLISDTTTNVQKANLRDININDLLGRTEVSLDMETIEPWVKGKIILVTGGGGSIGSEICRQLLQFDVGKIIIFDISENNAFNLKEELNIKFGQKARSKVELRIGSVQDKKNINAVFDEFHPSIVFHAAAYKHVPLLEQHPRLALENNVLGTYRTAICAREHGVEKFVFISTDKAVNPTSVMGASKRLAELLVLNLNHEQSTNFVCVRFGNVLDSNGSAVPIFKRQIENGGPVTITHPDIIRYFMTIPEAAKLVLETGSMANGGEIFILDMGTPVKIVDLAENLIRMAGLIPNIDIKMEYIGLRPGEKLYEELLLEEEGLRKTSSDKIFVVKPEANLRDRGEYVVDYIQNALDNDGDMRGVLKHFVEQYTIEESMINL